MFCLGYFSGFQIVFFSDPMFVNHLSYELRKTCWSLVESFLNFRIKVRHNCFEKLSFILFLIYVHSEYLLTWIQLNGFGVLCPVLCMIHLYIIFENFLFNKKKF